MFNDDPNMADDCGLGGHGLKIKFGQLFFSLLTKILPYVQCSATKKHRMKVCSTQWKSGTNYLLKYFYISSQAPLWLLQFQVTSHCSSDFSVRESTPTKPSSLKKVHVSQCSQFQFKVLARLQFVFYFPHIFLLSEPGLNTQSLSHWRMVNPIERHT